MMFDLSSNGLGGDSVTDRRTDGGDCNILTRPNLLVLDRNLHQSTSSFRSDRQETVKIVIITSKLYNIPSELSPILTYLFYHLFGFISLCIW